MDYTSVDTSQMAGLGVGYLIFCLVVMVVAIVAQWKIFTKAGRPGWYSIVPIFNIYQMFKIAGLSGWMILLFFVPVVGALIATILLAINLAKAFGKGTGFAVGLIFLSFIFYLILAFGSAEYQLKN